MSIGPPVDSVALTSHLIESKNQMKPPEKQNATNEISLNKVRPDLLPLLF